jgi:hypothetical protein
MFFQFYQNELGRFRASFDLTMDDNDEVINRAPSTAVWPGRVIRPEANAEQVLASSRALSARFG